MQASTSIQSSFRTARTAASSKLQIGILSTDNVAAQPVAGKKIRCFYWDPKAAAETSSVSQADALKQARTIDIDFISHNPVLVAQTVPKEAFAIQFLTVPDTSSLVRRAVAIKDQIFNNVAALVIPQARREEPEICLIGDVTTDVNGDLVLAPEKGRYIRVDRDAKILRKEDMRVFCTPYNAAEAALAAKPV